MQKWEWLGLLTESLKHFQCPSNLEPYSAGVITISSVRNSTLQNTILLTHPLKQVFQSLYNVVGIEIDKIICKLLSISCSSWSILSHQLRRLNNCSRRYNSHYIILFDNPDEPLNAISPTLGICERFLDHLIIFRSLSMYYWMLLRLAYLQNSQYHFYGW